MGEGVGQSPFAKLAFEEIRLHTEKNDEYTRGGDTMGNFNRVAAILEPYHLDMSLPECVAATYMLKQMDAALWMLGQGYDGTTENVATRLRDVSVYAKLMSILHDQTRAREALEEEDKSNDEDPSWMVPINYRLFGPEHNRINLTGSPSAVV